MMNKEVIMYLLLFFLANLPSEVSCQIECKSNGQTGIEIKFPISSNKQNILLGANSRFNISERKNFICIKTFKYYNDETAVFEVWDSSGTKTIEFVGPNLDRILISNRMQIAIYGLRNTQGIATYSSFYLYSDSGQLKYKFSGRIYHQVEACYFSNGKHILFNFTELDTLGNGCKKLILFDESSNILFEHILIEGGMYKSICFDFADDVKKLIYLKGFDINGTEKKITIDYLGNERK